MNLFLLLLLIAEICFGICAWLTPECLRWIAAHLLTRADVLDVGKKEHNLRMQYWQNEFGLNHASADERHVRD
jgi:hypothetical protein